MGPQKYDMLLDILLNNNDIQLFYIDSVFRFLLTSKVTDTC